MSLDYLKLSGHIPGFHLSGSRLLSASRFLSSPYSFQGLSRSHFRCRSDRHDAGKSAVFSQGLPPPAALSLIFFKIIKKQNVRNSSLRVSYFLSFAYPSYVQLSLLTILGQIFAPTTHTPVRTSVNRPQQYLDLVWTPDCPLGSVHSTRINRS